MADLRNAIQRRAAEVAEPTITSAVIEPSIDGLMVRVEPWRTETIHGEPVMVTAWYQNGGLVTCEGLRVKADGTPYVRGQVLSGVRMPANVRALFDQQKTAKTAAYARSTRPDNLVHECSGCGRKFDAIEIARKQMGSAYRGSADAIKYRNATRANAERHAAACGGKKAVADPKRIPGHKLETVSTRGGIVASCSCGEVYENANGRSTVFPTWDRHKIKAAHQRHLTDVSSKTAVADPRAAWSAWADAHPNAFPDSIEQNVEERGITEEADPDLFFTTCLTEARATYEDA